MRVGLGPRVRGPVNILRVEPTDSNTASRAEPRLRSIRALRVSLPWMVLAARLRPSGVLAPTDKLPWNLQTFFETLAGAQHCPLFFLIELGIFCR